jgi:photosystem II stability/assembly factor-like uncharacterized protein
MGNFVNLQHKVTRTTICLALLLSLATSLCAQVPNGYFSAMQWRLIGPFRGGRTIAAAGVPSEPNTFYFGSVDGGLFKSTNAGLTWSPITDGQPIASIGAIAIAASNPNIIYVGTGESDIRSNLASGDGVYKSTDGGHTWHNVGLRDTRQISRIVLDPANPDVVYVGALGYAYGPNDDRGVFKSSDGGATWHRVLYQGPSSGISDLTIATANPKVLFAATWSTHRPPWSTYAPIDGPGSGIYRSTDAGATWTELKANGLPAGDWSRTGVSVSPDGRRVYALIPVNPPDAALRKQAEDASGLYRSDDTGATWHLVNSDKRLTSRSWYFDWLTVDPSNPDVVYIPNVALYRTEDGGHTISIVRGAPGGDDYHELWVDSRNPAHLILATDQGASVSLDRGATWSSWYNQPTAQMYHVTTDNRFPYTVYGAQQDSGAIAVASRSDHGVISAQDWTNIGGGESGYLALDPSDPDIIYATGTYGGVSRYDRRTSLSQDITPWPMPNWASEINQRRYRAPWTPPLTFSPADKKSLYFGTQYVMKTTDGGLHWQTISPDLTGAKPTATAAAKPDDANASALGFGVVYSIAPSPLNAAEIWAGSDTGLLHLTLDGGKTWTNVTPQGVTDWSRVSMIEASHYEASTAFAAVDRHRLDDQRPYIYRTRDYGHTWQLITNGLGERAFLRAVREDPEHRGLLFAGTELGVYASFDDGDHWQPLQLNLPLSAVYDLAIHDNDLIAATHGRSYWVLDDITPLRQAAALAVQSARDGTPKAHLFEPAEAVRVDNDVFLGTPLPPEEPQAKNPPDGAILDYILSGDASPVTLEVYNDANQLVRKYSSAAKPSGKHASLPIAERWFPKPQALESSAGMHRFVWDLRWSTSGDALDDDEDQAPPPKGPRVVPGTYAVRLTVDGKSQTQILVVAMDPRTSATPAVLAEQERLGREIYGETMLSRKAISETGSVAKQLAGKKSPSAAATSFLAALNKIVRGDKSQMGLEAANTGLLASLRVVEGGDRETPSQAIELYRQSKQAFEQRAAEWQKLKTTELPQVNQELEKSGAKPIKMSVIEKEIEYLMTR